MKTRYPLSLPFVIITSLAWMLAAGNAMANPGPGAAQQRASSVGRASHGHSSRIVHAPRIGHQVRALPSGYHTVRVGRANYHYHNGAFYRPHSNSAFVVIGAPIGARVPYLPGGYVSFLYGSHRYFYVNYTYYFWDRKTEEYVVVEEPEGAEAALVNASEAGDGPVIVYPAQGQTDEQRDRDRYECHVWAVEQTGYDPSAQAPQIEKAADHRRALSACLEGRGYTVK